MGKGRNSVYLAGIECQVTAFDGSPMAVEKANALAVECGQDLDFNVSGVEDWGWSPSYDAVVAIFVQLAPPDLRAKMFNWMGLSVARKPM